MGSAEPFDVVRECLASGDSAACLRIAVVGLSFPVGERALFKPCGVLGVKDVDVDDWEGGRGIAVPVLTSLVGRLGEDFVDVGEPLAFGRGGDGGELLTVLLRLALSAAR